MKTWIWSLALVSTLFAAGAHADQTVEQGPWVLHYMTMNTTDLTPEIARTYDVDRSKKRGLLMLNLQHRDQPQVSVDHRTEGTIRNLIGQTRSERIRNVVEGDAIYTLIDFRYSHLETMRFEFDVYPVDGSPPIRLSFNQQLYTPGR